MPQIVVGGIYVIGEHVRIGEVSFETIPSRILLQFLIIDAHSHISLHFQELVVSALVYVVLSKCAIMECFF